MTPALLWVAAAAGAELVVQPYLQLATPTSIRVGWEAPGSEPGEVLFGDVGRAASTVVWTDGLTSIHEAELTGLTPGARVPYRVRSGGAESATYELRTPPADPRGRTWRFAAVSDMQRSEAEPEKWGEVAKRGILDWAEQTYGAPVADALDGVLIPGDLVETGPSHTDWTRDFFGLQHPLFAQVPFYAVIGNHEADADWYWRYIQAPADGDASAPERWWSHTLGDVLIIGLDSNPPYANKPQLDWLDARLEAACEDPAIDFVFAQLHHPAQSELWVAGNNPWSGFVQGRLEAFTQRCDRPSVMFFGHTHAYSRGQSQDARHLMVNVAVAGGAIDRWGAEVQRDYEAFSVSDDAWGWVLVEVDPSDNPALRLRRFSRGDREQTLENAQIDELVIHRRAPVPAAPSPSAAVGDAPVSGDCAVLQIDVPDPADVQAVHWQAAADCPGLDAAPPVDRWVQDQNVYFGADTLAGRDPLEARVDGPLDGGALCWRARVRSRELVWSPWSAPVEVAATPPTRTGELVVDGSGEAVRPGAWTLDGADVVGDGACGAPVPVDGAFVFGLGGRCGEVLPASISQALALSDPPEGAAGSRTLRVSFAASTASGARIEVRAGGAEVVQDVAGGPGWQRVTVELEVPAGATTAELRFVADDAAFIDDVRATFGAGGPPDCAVRPAPAAPEVVAEPGCGCGAGGGAAWTAWLALALTRRRSRLRRLRAG